MAVNPLDEIAIRYGTDKGTKPTATLSAKSYTVAYHRFLEAVRFEPITLLEIGVAAGKSLKMWLDYLPNAKIVAMDVNPACAKFATERAQVFIGDQTDAGFLKSVADATGPFDCIVDDGGHRMEHHQASLPVLWPYLREGGWYAIEDLHTCYNGAFGGGYGHPNSTMERVFKPMLDSLNSRKAPRPYVPNVASIHAYPSVVFMVKGAAVGPQAGARTAGS